MTMTTPESGPLVRGRLGDQQGALPLVAVEVTADVRELVATTTVRQTFRNTRATAIEATYVFPLPDRAGVTEISADLAGRIVDGVLRERGEARDEYDAAIAAGHRAAIAEEDRPGVFSMRVGNLQPGEEAVVTLTLTGPLAVDDGVAEYRFPLVVAPRYVPGTPLPGADTGTGVWPDTDRVPDASRITPPVLLPGQESPVRLSLRARLAVTGLDPQRLASTLHTVDVRPADGVTEVELRPGERLDRDVLLRWPVAGEALRTSAVVVRDDDGAGGTWQLTVVPPASGGPSRPRDVVVLLDRSGSMGGWKMVAARRAAARIVDSLGSADRFAVLAFDHLVERPGGGAGLVPGTDRERWAAVSALAELDARGGTRMLEPVVDAVRLLEHDEGDRDRYVVLVTDGQVANEDELVRALAPAAGRIRLFALGIDRAVNAGFLRRLAAAGTGRCDLVESEERLDEVLTTLHRRIAPPLATSLTVTADGAELVAAETAPRRAPDLFAGVPVVVGGRFRGAADRARFTVRGDGLEETVVAVRADDVAVRTVWARARVRDLEDRYASGHGGDELAAEIVATSLRFRVLSRFTAFVAVDRDRRTESHTPQPVPQPVEMPSGWVMRSAAGVPRMAKAAPRRMGIRAARAFGAMSAPDGGLVDADVAVAATVDVADAYRDRISALLDRIEAGDGGKDVPAALDELVADLDSVDAPAWLTDALRELLRAVRSGQDARPAIAAVRDLLSRRARPVPST